MLPAFEPYETERADFARLVEVVRKIQAAPFDELLSIDWLIERIRDIGLMPIHGAHEVYEGEEDYINGSQQGVIQIPREFARWLLLLAEHRPASYLEVGCFNGATATLATAYLQRFNPAFQATTIDIWPTWLFYSQVRDLIPLRYVVGRNSFEFADQRFDAVFIDGDHSFEWAWADYQNVGRSARICGIHDVNCAPYRELPLGGVCGAWELIRREEAEGAEFLEFFDHPSRPFNGIGVRLRKD